jgi:hypothetical protein
LIRRLLAGLALVCLTASFIGTAAASQSDNIKVVQRIKLPRGNEIEFDGSRIYVNGYAGAPHGLIHAFDLKGSRLRARGTLECEGLTDVAALDDDLIAIGLQQGGTSCNQPRPVHGGFVGGVHIADMSDPQRPSLLGSIELPGGVHTLTRYPGKPYVYASLGGADTHVAFGGLEHIVDVSDPDKPEITATYKSPLNPGGCHDVTFQVIEKKMIGFCPGLGGTEIWDASDPLAPKPLGRMMFPFTQLPHQVAVSSDGKMAAVSDEAYAGHVCNQQSPAGALWFYDISDLSHPELIDYYGPPRGSAAVGFGSAHSLSCTAHNFNFVPDSRLMVVAWIGGGTQVIDVSDPVQIKEVAHYRPERAVAMSSYWYRDRIFVADWNRGLEVLRLERS